MNTQWGESSGSGPSSVPLPAWPLGLAQTYLVIPERLHNLGNVEQDGVLWGAGFAVLDILSFRISMKS